MQHHMSLDRLAGHRSVSHYAATLAPKNLLSTLAIALEPDETPAAQVILKKSDCVDGRIMPNPYPDKKLRP